MKIWKRLGIRNTLIKDIEEIRRRGKTMKGLKGEGSARTSPQRTNESYGVELSRCREPLDNSPPEGG